MATLSADVQARFGEQFLIQLTNADASGGGTSATAIDTVRLDAASTDVQAEFEVRAGVTYDENDPRHVMACVDGVVLTLKARGPMPSESAEDLRNWRSSLDRVAWVTGRDRIMPQTGTTTTRSKGETGTPAFDDRAFRGIQQDKPRSAAGADQDG